MRQTRQIKNASERMANMLTLAALFISFVCSNAATFYSRNSANWNVNSTWSTAGFGGAAATNYPQANDTAKVGNTYTVTVNTSSACAQLDIGQGLSGIVQFSGAGTYTLTIGGNLTVNAGAILIYNTNGSKTHTLQIGGSITNNGTVDLYYDLNDIVNITLNTASNAVISGSGSWALNDVTINKSSTAALINVQANAFETAIGTLTGTSGTYIHNNSGTYSVNSGAVTDFAIAQNMSFQVPQGTMWFSQNSNRTYLYGSLNISGGTVYVGSTAGNNGLRYDQVGTNIPYLEISSGLLTVYGGISYSSGAASNPFSFRMTGGTILLNCGTSGTSVEAFFLTDVASSVFYMDAGTIIIQEHNSSGGSNNTDWGICGTNGTVTSLGGTVQFGNSFTPAGTTFDFIPDPNAIQPNFKITGPAAAAISLKTAKNTTVDFKLLSLYIDTNKTFDIQSILGISGNSKTMTLASTYDGTYAFYSRGTFTAETGTVIMGGNSSQSIGGTSGATFYNLTINNPAGVTLQLSESVSSLLTLSSGLLNTTASKIIQCTSTANATMGSSSSFVNGPMIQTVASSSLASRNYPIGKGTAYRPAVLKVTHSNGTSVTYTGEMFNTPAVGLNYALPSTINKVSYTRFWNFTRANVSNLSSATMTLYYDLDDSVTDRLRVAVVHDDGSSKWVDYGGTGTANNTGSITSGPITSFKNKFALGFPPSPLPVNLISFQAVPVRNMVKCEWQTASEVNNDYFTIERSADGVNYSSIIKIKGSGNSSTSHSYFAEDMQPLPGYSYYRLKQTDFDGKIQVADPVTVRFETQTGFVFYPNPAAEAIHVKNPGASMEGKEIVLLDMNGKSLPVSIQLSPDKNELTVYIDPAATSSNDFFVLNVLSAEGMTREKVLVGKK
jgi:hypothetical protein